MLEKWKQWAVKMNFRKAVIIFVVTGFVFAVASSVAVYSNFQGRISQWEKFSESDRDDGREEKEYKERKEKDWEEISKRLNLSAGDIALMAGCGIIGVGTGVWYWVLAAMVFNLVALAVLYLYAILKGTCMNCGRIRSGNGKFCDRCGTVLKKECPQCRQAADISSVYCSNCGKKLDEKE